MKLFASPLTAEIMEAASEACLKTGHFDNGPAAEEAEARVAELLGGGVEVLLTTSCTDALRLAYSTFDGPVWVPVMTWPGTYSGLEPARRRFYDVGLGIEHVSKDALVIVEYAGIPPGDRYLDDADWQNRRIIVDAAHGFALSHHGPNLRAGKFDAVCYSFGPVKEVSTVKGGALVMRKIPQKLRTQARQGVEKGSREPIRQVGTGNYLMSDFAANLLIEQLRGYPFSRHADLRRHRRQVASVYGELVGHHLVGLLSGHLMPLYARSVDDAVRIRRALSDAGIEYGCHYRLPLFVNPDRFPYGYAWHQRHLTLPCHHQMTYDDADRVVAVIRSATEKHDT